LINAIEYEILIFKTALVRTVTVSSVAELHPFIENANKKKKKKKASLVLELFFFLSDSFKKRIYCRRVFFSFSTPIWAEFKIKLAGIWHQKGSYSCLFFIVLRLSVGFYPSK